MYIFIEFQFQFVDTRDGSLCLFVTMKT